MNTEILQKLNAIVVPYSPVSIKDYPSKLNTAELPICLTIPGSGTWSHIAYNGSFEVVRTYNVMLYVEPVVQGKAFSNVETTLELTKKLGKLYLLNKRLAEGVFLISVGDNGLQVQTFSGIEYYGTTFNVEVREFNG